MEIGCPNCGQRLNVRAGLKNPTCRCPGCSHVFRAADYGYDPSEVASLPQESRASFDRLADRLANRLANRPSDRLAERYVERPAANLPPGREFDRRDEPPPAVVIPRPSPPKTPSKVGIGTMIFVAVIVVKILSRFLNHGPPARNHRPRNDLRPAVPIRQMQTQFERLPREIRGGPGEQEETEVTE